MKAYKSVYVLEFSNDTVKIGISKDVQQRIKTLSNASGLIVTRWYSLPPYEKSIALNIEHWLQLNFAETRIRGEFFTASFDDVYKEMIRLNNEVRLSKESVKSFFNSQFGTIRSMYIDDEIWFVGKDVAVALEYKNFRDALRKHVDEEDKRESQIATPGGKQAMTLINESGLYSLILSSKLPAAQKFKRWVTSEVLPAIRKSGFYNMNEKDANWEETHSWIQAMFDWIKFPPKLYKISSM